MKLSVLVTTYNHAPFIGRALESVADQRTNFDYEIVVADDCSQDGTREIVRDFAERHPGRTRLVLPKSNLGHSGNAIFRRQLETASGEYTALLDGDDYWTSNRKLQRQVDFLDAHPECSTCFHNVNVVYEGGGTATHLFHQDEPRSAHARPTPKPRSTLADIVRGNFIQTCSVVLRAGPIQRLPGWYESLRIGDWPLYVLSAEHGTIAYLDEVMATYRVHPGGLWSAELSAQREFSDVEAIAHVYDVLNRHLAHAFDSEIRPVVADLYRSAAFSFYAAGRYRWASVCARRALRRFSAAERVRHWRLFAVLALAVGRER